MFNPLIATFKSVSFVFEIDMPTYINYLQIFMGVFAWGFILQTLVEFCLLNYWVEFVWKSVRPIDDQFISIFLYLLNCMAGLLFTIWNIILESAIDYSQLSRPGFWIDKYSLHIKLVTFLVHVKIMIVTIFFFQNWQVLYPSHFDPHCSVSFQEGPKSVLGFQIQLQTQSDP